MGNEQTLRLADLSPLDVKMLELLTHGCSGKELAARLGYSDGTARVYLHTLYRRIGVDNKTAASMWYSQEKQRSTDELEQPTQVTANTFGQFAIRHGLGRALGAFAVFLGPQEIRNKPQGAANAKEALKKNMFAEARTLWDCLVDGDFAAGKRAAAKGVLPPLVVANLEGAISLAAHLSLGGYSASALQARNAITKRKSGDIGASDETLRILKSISAVIDRNDSAALSYLHQHGVKSSETFVRQLALVSLFHVYQAHAAAERAEEVASAIWLEAERARAQDRLRGQSYFPSSSSLSVPAVPAKQVLRHEKRLSKGK